MDMNDYLEKKTILFEEAHKEYLFAQDALRNKDEKQFDIHRGRHTIILDRISLLDIYDSNYK